MENPGRKGVTDSLHKQAFTAGEYPRFSRKDSSFFRTGKK